MKMTVLALILACSTVLADPYDYNRESQEARDAARQAENFRRQVEEQNRRQMERHQQEQWRRDQQLRDPNQRPDYRAY